MIFYILWIQRFAVKPFGSKNYLSPFLKESTDKKRTELHLKVLFQVLFQACEII